MQSYSTFPSAANNKFGINQLSGAEGTIGKVQTLDPLIILNGLIQTTEINKCQFCYFKMKNFILKKRAFFILLC